MADNGVVTAAQADPVRFPAPLQPGDRIGVTAPSSGVADRLRARFDFCVEHVRGLGYDVVLGDCLGDGDVSAPAAEPTWLVGWSDLSTLLLPLTLVTGWATLHGGNLMETPYAAPEPLLHWLQVAGAPPGTPLLQGAAAAHRAPGSEDWQNDPRVVDRALQAPSRWRLLHPERGPVRAGGRLVGGCIETVSTLVGSAYGDVAGFGRAHGPLVVYLEAAEAGALTVARQLWAMRLAGWFDAASAVLVGRTSAPAEEGFSQEDAVRSALGALDVPVVLDVDCGHVPPQLSLVNGAQAEVVVDGATQTLRQTLA